MPSLPSPARSPGCVHGRLSTPAQPASTRVLHVVSYPRSGSSLLTSLFVKSDDALSLFEMYNEDFEFAHLNEFSLKEWEWARHRFAREFHTSVRGWQRDHRLAALLLARKLAAARNRHWLVYKDWPPVPWVDPVLGWGSTSALGLLVQESHDERVAVLWLRRNFWMRHVSLLKALPGGCRSAASYTNVNTTGCVVNTSVAAMADALREAMRIDALMRQLLKRSKPFGSAASVAVLAYEEVASLSHLAALKLVMDRLRKSFRPAGPLTFCGFPMRSNSSYTRQDSSRSLRARVANYDELHSRWGSADAIAAECHDTFGTPGAVWQERIVPKLAAMGWDAGRELPRLVQECQADHSTYALPE